MKIVKADCSWIKQEPGLDGMYKMIEYAARICTHSTHLMSKDSKEFVDRLEKQHHGRTLEFGTVYLRIPTNFYDEEYTQSCHNIFRNHWTKVNYSESTIYVTTNYRVIVECKAKDLLQFFCEPTPYHNKRHTILYFPIARSIADEFRTHVGLSSIMESTRYCNYSKDKYSNEVTFVDSIWTQTCSPEILSEYEKALEKAEYEYLKLCQMGCKAEEARNILPLAVCTTFMQCGFEDDFENFFRLRASRSEGNVPHPDSIFIAQTAQLSKPYAKN